MNPEQKLELLKFALSLAVSLVVVGLGWLVGLKLTAKWNFYQKRREFDLASAEQVHRLYGEFFAVWKLWNYAFDHTEHHQAGRQELLLRACAAEGAFESVLVRLASTRDISPDQCKVLGQCRQSYQTLRESIRDDLRIDWDSNDHPEYVKLKDGVTALTCLIISDPSDAPLAQGLVRSRTDALKAITSNVHETRRQNAAIT